MYIEFFGLPGSGKSTFAEVFNKSKNLDSRLSLSAVFKIFFNYSRFLSLIIYKFFTSPSITSYFFKRPWHFFGFLKGFLVRFIIVYRHEKSGYFIQDHGLVQMLTQNNYWRKEFFKDKEFLKNVFNTFPDVHYIYLESSKKISVSRTIKRDKERLFSDEFLEETKTIFEESRKHLKIKTIKTNANKTEIMKRFGRLKE